MASYCILSLMLSLFPELLFLSPFAAFLIRVALAVVFATSAYRRFPSRSTLLNSFGAIDAAIALMLIAGFYTQLAALIAVMCTAGWLIKSDWNPFPKSTTALALVMALTLLLTGAGPFAFDLPL